MRKEWNGKKKVSDNQLFILVLLGVICFMVLVFFVLYKDSFITCTLDMLWVILGIIGMVLFGLFFLLKE